MKSPLLAVCCAVLQAACPCSEVLPLPPLLPHASVPSFRAATASESCYVLKRLTQCTSRIELGLLCGKVQMQADLEPRSSFPCPTELDSCVLLLLLLAVFRLHLRAPYSFKLCLELRGSRLSIGIGLTTHDLSAFDAISGITEGSI